MRDKQNKSVLTFVTTYLIGTRSYLTCRWTFPLRTRRISGKWHVFLLSSVRESKPSHRHASRRPVKVISCLQGGLQGLSQLSQISVSFLRKWSWLVYSIQFLPDQISVGTHPVFQFQFQFAFSRFPSFFPNPRILYLLFNI